MPVALRLNFTDVVRDGTLKNVYAGGKKVGYQFDVRLSYYRGHFLSVIDELSVKTDGMEVPANDITFCLKGEEYGLAQLHDLVTVFWPIAEPATIKIFKPGGLEAGQHEIDFHLLFRSPYMEFGEGQYMPCDSSEVKMLELYE